MFQNKQTMSASDKAKEFLQTAHLYHLGDLPTEQPHELTKNLSQLIQDNLPQSIQLLKKVDEKALNKFSEYLPQLESLKSAIEETFQKGHRVFLCGCGATGRLSLTLEYLWKSEKKSDQVVAFMAGGDTALVHAIEGFEDFPEYGVRQLKDLGFAEGDLLIASTEGGETPFVIGACEEASRLSQNKPFFLYCNPKEVLVDKVERSRQVLENQQIHSICLYTGSMAISGSTRMQASTVLQLAIGLCLLTEESVAADFQKFFDSFQAQDFSFLEKYILAESEAYQKGELSCYTVDSDYAITVFTDSTERAPTFSLKPFSHLQKPYEPSLTYISLKGSQSAQDSWEKLLLRKPRPLNWQEPEKLSEDYIYGFDFSEQAIRKREELIPAKQHLFAISAMSEGYRFSWNQEISEEVLLPQLSSLFRHCMLKLHLNTMSTLIMGRLNRYRSNLMTYVMPTNGKLIDRAARYIMILLKEEGIDLTYEAVIHELFIQLETLKPDEPIVLKVFQKLSS